MNYKLRIKNLLLFLFIFHSSFFILHSQARAEGFSVGLYPPILEIEATPPANIEAPLSVENLGDQEISLDIVFKPFVPSDRENGEIRYITDSDELPGDPLLYQRINILDQDLAIKELTLGPKQKKELKVSINIPRETLASDYYFSIVFVSKTSNLNETSGSKIAGGVASNVLLSVGKNGPAKGSIVEFSSSLLLERGPVPFNVRVKNSSNFFIAPRGEIIIENVFGQPVGRVDLLPVNILAGSVRAMPSEDGETEALWDEKMIFGPYKASLTLMLSEEGPLFRKELIFFSFPYSGALGFLIILIIVIYVWRKVKRKL